MTRVLIALDDSDASVDAAAVARQLFGDDTEFLAIYVFERSPAGISPLRDPITWGVVWQYDVYAATEEDSEIARELAARDAREAAEHVGLADAEPIGDVGDPADAIIRAAHAHDVDVIVVGSHERNWFARLFDPSVAAEVVKRADIPVLVAK